MKTSSHEKFAGMELVKHERATMVDEPLNGVLHKMIHNAESGLRSVLYNVVEQVMVDMLQRDVIGKTLDAHIAKFLCTDEVAEGVSTRLLTLPFLMAPMGTSVRRKTDTATEKKKFSTAVEPKVPRDIILVFDDDNESPPSRSDSGSEKIPLKKSSKRCSKRSHSKRRRKDARRHSSSSKSSKEKYDTCSEHGVRGYRAISA